MPNPNQSWVHVDAASDFPVQNLPFGIFETDHKRAGIAIGDYVLDLDYLHQQNYFTSLALPPTIFAHAVLNPLFALGRKKVGEVRRIVASLLDEHSVSLRDNATDRQKALVPLRDVVLHMPVKVSNYTDFYSSEEHATNVGSMFRDPKNALLPNWKHLPVAYHGRASSIVVSGTPIRRPMGQIRLPDAEYPILDKSRKLDFELEVAFITCKSTALGSAITVNEAEDHIIGLVLFNDWSARDIQQWEYVPLGPFLGKNFGSTISPWVVTLDALEPFRCEGPIQSPEVLPYLKQEGHHHYDIRLEVMLKPDGVAPVSVCRSNYKYLYWSMAQQLAHHTINGCNIEVGDIYASGTISGPSPGSYGSMLELSWNGKRPLPMQDGTVRYFLEDGDTIIMKAYVEHDGVRIGFGDCTGTITPARV